MKKILMFFVVACIIAACSNKPNKQTIAAGKRLYKQHCTICHGIDGKLGLNDSKDLTASKLTDEEKTIIIKNGKGKMTPFGSILTPKNIEAVVAYTNTLK